jgi:hypothetical protein
MKYGNFVEATGELSTHIKFLSRALNTNTAMLNLLYIFLEPSYIEQGKLLGVACDRRSLHIVDPLCYLGESGLAAGFWRFLKNDEKYNTWLAKVEIEDLIFPSYRKVIPHGKPVLEFELEKMPYGEHKRDAISIAKFFRELPKNTVIDLDHLDALDCDRDWAVKWYGDETKKLLFENSNYTAVITQMRLDN